MDNKATKGTPINLTDVCPTYLRTCPTCPEGGTYVLGKVGERPRCTLDTAPNFHVLP